MGNDGYIELRVEMEAILREQDLGYLGLEQEGRPYVAPLNYAYTDGRIIFHCALEGRKLDAIAANPRVCFTVARQFEGVSPHEGTRCHLDSDSVICFGRARVLEEFAEKAAALNAFNRAFRPTAPDLAPERVASCAAVEIAIEEMTGRRERDRVVTRWRWRFGG